VGGKERSPLTTRQPANLRSVTPAPLSGKSRTRMKAQKKRRRKKESPTEEKGEGAYLSEEGNYAVKKDHAFISNTLGRGLAIDLKKKEKNNHRSIEGKMVHQAARKKGKSQHGNSSVEGDLAGVAGPDRKGIKLKRGGRQKKEVLETKRGCVPRPFFKWTTIEKRRRAFDELLRKRGDGRGANRLPF